MERLTERDEFGNADIIGVGSEDLQLNLDFEQMNKVTNALNKLAQFEDLEELIGIPLKDIAKIFYQNIPEDCKHPHKAIVLTDDDIDKWNGYKNAEEQGLLLRLPCPIGTTVYNTTWWDDVTEKVDVDGKTFYRTVHKHKVSKSTFSLVDIYDFGKTVFLTRAEAEQKLKEMESD